MNLRDTGALSTKQKKTPKIDSLRVNTYENILVKWSHQSMLPGLSTRKKPGILVVRVDEVSIYAEEESAASNFNQMGCIK